MFSSLCSSPFSNAFTDACAAVGRRKISVEPHQIMMKRLAPDDFLNSRMSARTNSANSILFLPVFTLGPSSLRT